MVGELPTNARGSGSSEIVTPSTVIAAYIILIIILGILTFRLIPKDKEYKATAAVGGMGITLLLGLMTQSLTVLNARDQIRAARGNLQRQIESTERLAEAQRAHTAALADKQSAYNRELESLRAMYGLLQQQYKSEEERRREKEKEQATVRLNYLDPLRVAVADFAERMKEILNKRTKEANLPPDHKDSVQKMVDRFHQVKHPEARPNEDARKPLGHNYWSNGEGYFAMSSIYLAALYFYQANRARREFPFGALRPGDDAKLIAALDDVRGAIGGYWGIFTTLQDSAGDYVRLEDGQAMGYIQFYENMYKEEERARLLRIIDFFRDIDQKSIDEITRMKVSLENLVGVVRSVSQIDGQGPDHRASAARTTDGA